MTPKKNICDYSESSYIHKKFINEDVDALKLELDRVNRIIAYHDENIEGMDKDSHSIKMLLIKNIER